MKLITWNVNSLRVRLERVIALLERHAPDVLCLQETKVTDELFPREAFEPLGYHCAVSGQRTYNGVAILCRQPPERVVAGFDGNPAPEQARVLGVDVGGVRVICLYVVNGQSVDSDKYQLKLRWLEALGRWIRAEYRPEQPLVVAGDINIAPDDRDVFDPDLWHGKVLCSDLERQWLQGISAWGLVDLLRLHDEKGGIYSWWDYRHGAFHRDRGLRIDLVLGTKLLADQCREMVIDRDERKVSTGEGKPSDHAPVIATFD